MANVTVKMYGIIREKINHDSVQISGNTFIEAIRKLVSEYPELKGEVLNEDMNLKGKGDLIYLLNGRALNKAQLCQIFFFFEQFQNIVWLK